MTLNMPDADEEVSDDNEDHTEDVDPAPYGRKKAAQEVESILSLEKDETEIRNLFDDVLV